MCIGFAAASARELPAGQEQPGAALGLARGVPSGALATPRKWSGRQRVAAPRRLPKRAPGNSLRTGQRQTDAYRPKVPPAASRLFRS
eukprot:2022275-Alexandrium_andersonii.AAC.1